MILGIILWYSFVYAAFLFSQGYRMVQFSVSPDGRKNWDHVSSYLCTYKLKRLVSCQWYVSYTTMAVSLTHAVSIFIVLNIATVSQLSQIKEAFKSLETSCQRHCEQRQNRKREGRNPWVPWNCRDALNHQVIFISHACKLIIVILKM